MWRSLPFLQYCYPYSTLGLKALRMRDGEPVYCLQNPAFLSQIRLCCNGKCLCLDMLNCSLHFAGICTILTEWLKASSISQPDLWITYHQYSAYLFPSSSKGNPKEGSIWHTHQSQVGSFNFPHLSPQYCVQQRFLSRGREGLDAAH